MLNLSKNCVTHAVAPLVKQYLIKNKELDELYLHWNHLGAVGLQQVCEALLSNSTIKILDLSANSMYGSEQAVAAFSKVL